MRLQATSSLGLNSRSIRAGYIMQYANSLIGRQLKIVVQTAVFHCHDLLSHDMIALWKAIGELTALLWLPAIDEMETFLVSPRTLLVFPAGSITCHQNNVRVATNNVLDLFSKIAPSKIITKPKLHLLTHLPDDIRRFGPLVGEATETFECFNAIFRFCSVLSNHQAPSRDIAIQLANQEGFKQRVTGGWWPDALGDWKRSGPGVRSSLERYKTLKNNLGWADSTVVPPGLCTSILIVHP